MFLTHEQNEKRTIKQLFSQRYMMNPLFHSNKNETAFENIWLTYGHRWAHDKHTFMHQKGLKF